MRLVKAVRVRGGLRRARYCVLAWTRRRLIARVIAPLGLVERPLLIVVGLDTARFANLGDIATTRFLIIAIRLAVVVTLVILLLHVVRLGLVGLGVHRLARVGRL